MENRVVWDLICSLSGGPLMLDDKDSHIIALPYVSFGLPPPPFTNRRERN